VLATGRQNQDIAEELMALSTVKRHVTHILDKLGAANRPRPPPAPASLGCSSSARPVPPSTTGRTCQPGQDSTSDGTCG
jgi:hypothetical protein